MKITKIETHLVAGITNCKKIASIAEANYIEVIPHDPSSQILTVSSVQFCAAIHNIYTRIHPK